ncbi:MAG: diacylglycerol kinase family lipid kinase [Deltaproteobacteria bacterium]|nr:MAG: diacylglycerol kinase family lipid kinase [Deltaproteobacteria bacterium]
MTAMSGVDGRRALVLLNPAAGGGRCGTRVSGALARLREAGWTLEVRETGAPGDATRWAAEAWAAGERRFIAAGGDGTAWEVVSGLMPAVEAARSVGGDPTGGEKEDVQGGGVTTDNRTSEGARVPVTGEGGGVPRAELPWLGFLPGGTGNSFLRDFGDGGLEMSLAAMLEGRERRVDVGCLRTRGAPVYSLNLLSIGFVADICDTANRRYKRLGELSYVLGLVQELATLRPMRVRLAVDGGPWEARELTFLSLNNSRFTGGAMMMAPGADPSDGEVDLITVEPFGRLALLGVFPRIFRGTHVEDPRVGSRRAREVRLALEEEVAVMVDGEVVRAAPVSYEVLPAALRVAVPGGNAG